MQSAGEQRLGLNGEAYVARKRPKHTDYLQPMVTSHLRLLRIFLLHPFFCPRIFPALAPPVLSSAFLPSPLANILLSSFRPAVFSLLLPVPP